MHGSRVQAKHSNVSYDTAATLFISCPKPQNVDIKKNYALVTDGDVLIQGQIISTESRQALVISSSQQLDSLIPFIDFNGIEANQILTLPKVASSGFRLSIVNSGPQIVFIQSEETQMIFHSSGIPMGTNFTMRSKSNCTLYWNGTQWFTTLY